MLTTGKQQTATPPPRHAPDQSTIAVMAAILSSVKLTTKTERSSKAARSAQSSVSSAAAQAY